MSLLTLLLTIWFPPEFPRLPEGYYLWKECDNDYWYRYDTFFLQGYTDGDMEISYENLPYTFNTEIVEFTYVYGNSLFGRAEYYFYDEPEQRHNRKEYIITIWYPHHEYDSLDTRISHKFWGYISYDTLGFEEVTLGETNAWRIRGMWWEKHCDGGVHICGPFSHYIVSGNDFDYRITCMSRIYILDRIGPDCAGLQHYPNRIAELEQAVEQAFRAKE